MHRVFRAISLALAFTLPATAIAQQQDPAQDLLNAGRRVFADLDYHAADSIATVVLGVAGLRRSQRIQALQLAAASRFPAVER